MNSILQQIISLSQLIKSKQKIEIISENILNYFGLIAILGAEIEFYLTKTDLISILEKKLNINIKEEKGTQQYEINICPSSNILHIIKDIEKYCKNINDICLLHGGRAVFAPKPYSMEYGNSIHLHINFVDLHNNNFFDSKPNLHLAAKSLCNFMMETFLVFAFHNEDYKRFDHKFMAPTHVCYGNNNRTVAIRIPDSKPIRLEHRVSSFNTDLHLAIYAIIKSIYLGLIAPHKIRNYSIIYGNAFDEQYNLTPFPNCLNAAVNLFNIDFFTQELPEI